MRYLRTESGALRSPSAPLVLVTVKPVTGDDRTTVGQEEKKDWDNLLEARLKTNGVSSCIMKKLLNLAKKNAMEPYPK